ncbi:MAG: tRNA (adenosine(37)-N6)-threonylcarbamoyltransferase complex transferase subunit TsaD [Candidatus Omnitrophica bacterium]|nr:tRNA (adenosine(37)-N6)-threonylcarbamoyltransferase complex transferase subunit TsaD [Candidatus Omnitrophota bacterium]
MYTLGIETSCDETACAVLKNGDDILANVISSSLAKHKPFGGVVPEIASRHCLEAIDLVYEEALKRSKVKPNQIDLIAVTRGPGLIGSIFVGVSFAKALSFSLDVPLVGVNHIEAHLEANFIGRKKPSKFIGLIVSGGHTSLVKWRNGRYQLLGETVDDAIGEAYDKVAKILSLGYPGGPVIDQLARQGNPKVFSFTKPKQEGKFDFSFSGIKTAVLNLVEREKPSLRGVPKGRRSNLGLGIASASLESSPRNDRSFVHNLCASFQEAVMGWVVQKTILACEQEKIKSIVVGGGVSANSRLRELLQEQSHIRGFQLFLPSFELTTDNAVMTARLGYVLYRKGERSDLQMAADPSLTIASGPMGRRPRGEGSHGTFKQ